ncbi:TetR/AcrR family transcriptional regulator [Bacillus horti]|uniref:AcrR family transcriptional regulator n=1 Tax=Caldalkalibacillus horti TaxID=77523 RepID=A0ABT9W566_9BACI|nr:TetR/AcrR family transcriptional regulator [Bacillus horti]MDQ0168398.1 AcrR family transcriptional regulator [Bacillus horti]
MSKKEKLLEAAANIIEEKGITQLTLEAVAAEAGVSKGGLLYHFHTKDELLKALNEQTILEFRRLVQDELEEGKSYTLAYLHATFKQLNAHGALSSDASILGALVSNHDLQKMWDTEYQRFKQEALKEDTSPELSLIIRLVCDGFIFSNMFKLDPIKLEEQKQMLSYLADLVEEKK